MNSSGIKRGLAGSAIAALAVTGLPFLASSASATPISGQAGVDGVTILSQGYTVHSGAAIDGDHSKYKNTATTTNDGQNTSISLVAAAPTTVTSVAFEYYVADSATPTLNPTWLPAGGSLARNADGVFATEWSPTIAAGKWVHLRAVPNTGELNATYDAFQIEVDDHALELSTEGPLGIYQNPHTAKDNVAVRGTVGPKSTQTSVNVFDTLRDQVNAQGIPVDYDATTGVGTFAGVLQYDHTGANSYPYSNGTEANQVSLTGAIDDTEDTEASTYYIQTISQVTAAPKSTVVAGTNKTPATITVLDGQGKPVAGATVGYVAKGEDTSKTPAADVDHKNVAETDANGQATVDLGAGTYVMYADADSTAGHSAGDKDAAPFTISSYTPSFSTIKIVNLRDRVNFDNDELADGGDDFAIETRDQQGNLISDSNGVQYRWIVDAAGTANDADTDWKDASQSKAGVYTVPAPPATPDATYTLEARRPNVGGTGLVNADPVSVKASAASVVFADGASANAPIEGSYTVTGTVKNDDGALAGRKVLVSYGNNAGHVDSKLAPQDEQPAGVTRQSDTTATVITDKDGNFSVKLVDPAGPVVVQDVPETDNFTVTDVQEAKDDTTSLNASKTLVVNWKAQEAVDHITIDTSNKLFGDAAPGKPVEVKVHVYRADTDNNPNNDELTDYPVKVTVDKGFLTEDASNPNGLTLADGHDSEGDLFGYYDQLGQSKDLSTGDNGTAGIVAAIEKDAGFDDDGMVTMTVTVKAGDKTETKDITFDSRNPLNLGDVSFQRIGTGDAVVGQDVNFNLFAKDQFGNLAGEKTATISDDSTVADFETDGPYDQTQTDWTTSGAGIRAFSNAPTVQTLMAMLTNEANTVDANGNLNHQDSKTVSAKSEPINWVAAPNGGGDKFWLNMSLQSENNGPADDVLRINANNHGAGLTADVYKKTNHGLKKLTSVVLNSHGNKKVKVADMNRGKFTTYVVKVAATDTTHAAKKHTRVR